MNFEKVAFSFCILLALTLNFGFFIGDIENPAHHHIYELGAAIIVSLIATIMKFGDRSHLGAVVLASSLVADIQLITAAFIWGMAGSEISGETMASIVSLSGGALVANLVSAVLLVASTLMDRK